MTQGTVNSHSFHLSKQSTPRTGSGVRWIEDAGVLKWWERGKKEQNLAEK